MYILYFSDGRNIEEEENKISKSLGNIFWFDSDSRIVFTRLYIVLTFMNLYIIGDSRHYFDFGLTTSITYISCCIKL